VSDTTALDAGTPGSAGKPPPASLSVISVKGKIPPPRKNGDLTRLFELAREPKQPAPEQGEVVALALPPERAEETPPPPPSQPAPSAFVALDLASAIPADTVEPLALSLDTLVDAEGSVTVAVEDFERAPRPAEPGAEIAPLAVHATAAAALPEETQAATEGCSLPRWVVDAVMPPTPVETFSEPAPEPEPALAEPPTSVPEPVAVAEPVVVDPAPAETPAAVPPPEFEAIIDYWRYLRGSSEFPTTSQVDRAMVSERWPSSLLLAFTSMSSDPRAEPELSQVMRLGRASADAESAVDYSPYATRWMLELGRAALRAAEPVEELARLSTASGSRGFRLVALPLGPAGADPDTVLCELAPPSDAPRFGKRRVWLED
jgi:hypothetical protein